MNKKKLADFFIAKAAHPAWPLNALAINRGLAIMGFNKHYSEKIWFKKRMGLVILHKESQSKKACGHILTLGQSYLYILILLLFWQVEGRAGVDTFLNNHILN